MEGPSVHALADTERDHLGEHDRLTIWCPACQPAEPAAKARETGPGSP